MHRIESFIHSLSNKYSTSSNHCIHNAIQPQSLKHAVPVRLVSQSVITQQNAQMITGHTASEPALRVPCQN